MISTPPNSTGRDGGRWKATAFITWPHDEEDGHVGAEQPPEIPVWLVHQHALCCQHDGARRDPTDPGAYGILAETGSDDSVTACFQRCRCYEKKRGSCRRKQSLLVEKGKTSLLPRPVGGGHYQTYPTDSNSGKQKFLGPFLQKKDCLLPYSPFRRSPLYRLYGSSFIPR